MFKKLLLSCTLILTACSNHTGQAQTAPPVFDSASMDAMLSEAVDSGEVIGVQALVFDEGHTVYHKSFGLADRERGTPVAVDTVYRIYSMTKPVTSALIMDLMEEGKLALTDPVSRYIPELAQMKVVSAGPDGTPVFTDQQRPITIEDLLLHRSGMAYGIFGGFPVEQAYQTAQLFEEDLATNMTRLSQLPLLAQPGDAWFYSYSIDVLGRVAEVVSGISLDQLMDERFFTPLGMSETGFHVQPEQTPRFASNYIIQPDGQFILEDDGQNSPFADLDKKFFSGGGGLVSTTEDYLKFARMLLNEGELNGTRVLTPETVRLMIQDHLSGDMKFLLPWIGGDTGAGFGYGGSVQNTATPQQQTERGRYAGQFGWGGAARTNFWIDPENKAIGMIMLQFFSPADPEIHNRFQSMVLEQTRNDRAVEP